MKDTVVGWKEWVVLPELGIPGIKTKVDTGALTSSIHAFDIAIDSSSEQPQVCFSVMPFRKRNDVIIKCVAPLLDTRHVKNSGGVSEERVTISTRLKLGPVDLTTEVTLTSRDDMLFRMLLGRRAMKQSRIYVDSGSKYLHGNVKARDYDKLLLAEIVL